MGSEPGMGWNFVKTLAPYHELHIITESKFQSDLEQYFSENPKEKDKFHFYFIQKERHKTLRKIWPPSYYWFYKRWQLKAYELAKKIDAIEHFDIVHQLNMVGYREPGYLYKLDKPFVWGPMGGFNVTPWILLPTMGTKGMVFYGMRNIINIWQMKHSSRVSEAVRNSAAIITATKDDHDAVLKLWNKENTVIPEVGFQNMETCNILKREGKLKICWSGLHIPRKSLNLLFEALANMPYKNEVELHVIGEGECTSKWKCMAEHLGLTNIIWHGWVEKKDALRIMQQSHLFVITSLSDATSTVLLEALSLGLPVIATNHLGFANVVTTDCGIKIDLHNHKQVIMDFASAISKVCKDESFRLQLANGAKKRADDFSWEGKAMMINKIYREIVNI